MIYFVKVGIMTKCAGCGATLQTENVSLEGYTKSADNKFCARCFDIKNYNSYQNISKINEDFTNIFATINKSNDLVLLLVDVLDLDSIKQIRLKNDIILVITKRDILSKNIKDNKFTNIETDLNIVDKIVISSNKNYHLDELLSKIKKHQKSPKVYVVGFTNVGKSTLINKLIYNYSDYQSDLTVSSLPSTTLDFLEKKLSDDLIIVDTPGLIDNGNICNYLDESTLKKVLSSKPINPKIYQIKVKQSLIFDDILRVDSKANVLTFYMSNQLNIDRIYKENNKLKNLYKRSINVKANEDIVILGLGFIKVKYDEVIDIYTYKDVKVYTRKSIL